MLDTNVRRVLARAVSGVEFPAASVTKAERALAESLVPDEQPATWAVAVMELGALVCTAASPALRDLPDQRPVRLEHCRPSGVRRTTAPRPGLGRHRPPGPGSTDGRAPGGRGQRGPPPAGRRLVGPGAARTRAAEPARRRARRRDRRGPATPSPTDRQPPFPPRRRQCPGKARRDGSCVPTRRTYEPSRRSVAGH